MKVCIDPGHGMSNRSAGVYDSGAESHNITEAGMVMDYANELRDILRERKIPCMRTRVDSKDPAPVGQRAGIAKEYGCDIMISLHCNAANGSASGTETFYRGETNKNIAKKLNDAVVKSLGTKDRGVKTEESSQHSRLAVMSFPKCFLIELGFIDNEGDRIKMLNKDLRKQTCIAIADVLEQGV